MVDPNSTLESKRFYVTDQVYAVTIQPDDMRQHYGKQKRLFLFRRDYYNDFFLMPKYGIEYKFQIELSEPRQSVTNKPRLHMHGWVRFKTEYAVFRWLYSVMPKLLVSARLEITKCTDIEVWESYMSKQEAVFSDLDVLFTNTGPDSSPRSEA